MSDGQLYMDLFSFNDHCHFYVGTGLDGKGAVYYVGNELEYLKFIRALLRETGRGELADERRLSIRYYAGGTIRVFSTGAPDGCWYLSLPNRIACNSTKTSWGLMSCTPVLFPRVEKNNKEFELLLYLLGQLVGMRLLTKGEREYLPSPIVTEELEEGASIIM
jgi:hypothetical protein